MTSVRNQAKSLAGRMPWAPELYQDLVAGRRPPEGGFALERLEHRLPTWSAAVGRAAAARRGPAGKRVLVVGALPWWVEFAAALGLLLRSQGHRVDLGLLPYRRWTAPVHPFDLRRQRAYLARILRRAAGVRMLDLSLPARRTLPAPLEAALDRLCETDVEYTLQRENPDLEADPAAAALYALRRSRNRDAAANALRFFGRWNYDSVVIPNGSILEFGAVYQAARFLGLTTVTYEFGEQRERVWLCRDGEAMRLETGALWEARGATELTRLERRQVEELVEARKGGRTWEQFGRRWQRGESQGAAHLRQTLGLEQGRPVVVVATNVVGDSLALNRQIFTHGMADWLAQTLQHLARRADVQTVVRVHPGELLGAGLTSEQVVRGALPDVPSHVTLISPDSPVNTYDLIGCADVGLVYTSTAGLEMAMHGVPVVTAGRTHFRGKGFTDDPETIEEYRAAIDRRLEGAAGGLPPEQVDLAWRYAHRFFFEFPFPFPWHLLHFWSDLEARPLEALVESGVDRYREALDAMAGDPIDWGRHGPTG